MPFYEQFTRIEQFIPNPENFNADRDLIRIRFKSQQLFAGFIKEQWAIALGDPTMSPSMLEAITEKPYNPVRVEGISIDKARVGVPALFSVLGYDWRNTWKSAEPVSELAQVSRTARMKSTVILLKNR